MNMRKTLVALAVLAGGAILGSLATPAPAEAQGWHHRHHHYGYGYRPVRRCWTEIRTVRVHTRYGIRWRERPVTICR